MKLRKFVLIISNSFYERRYDAITIDGKLKWQNELNEKNEAFFDCCDAIFLNYGWKTSHLIQSLNLSNRKNRKNDVFVGVDVFGRGCFGNGGFNTDLAIDFIKKFQLSIALFAIGKNFGQILVKF